jgi:hypothetical protein
LEFWPWLNLLSSSLLEGTETPTKFTHLEMEVQSLASRVYVVHGNIGGQDRLVIEELANCFAVNIALAEVESRHQGYDISKRMICLQNLWPCMAFGVSSFEKKKLLKPLLLTILSKQPQVALLATNIFETLIKLVAAYPWELTRYFSSFIVVFIIV